MALLHAPFQPHNISLFSSIFVYFGILLLSFTENVGVEAHPRLSTIAGEQLTNYSTVRLASKQQISPQRWIILLSRWLSSPFHSQGVSLWRVKSSGVRQSKIYKVTLGSERVKTVSSTYIFMGHYYHSLSVDATIMVSKNCPIISEHVGI